MSSSESMERWSAVERCPGLGVWNLYFLGKFILLWAGALNFQLLPNLLFAAVLLLPLPRWVRYLRTALAVPAAVALFYHDTWLPPFRRLLEAPGVLDFSADYLLELAERFIDWQWLGGALLLVFAYLLLAPWLRFTTLSVAGLLWLSILALPLPAPRIFGDPPVIQAPAGAATAAGKNAAVAHDAPDNVTLESYLSDFYRSEAARHVRFEPAERGGPFDLLVINVCSLSWDDLRTVGLNEHPLFRRMDIQFDNFNSAASYSGPAAIRLLRANCGQNSHAGLYQPAGDQCLLFDNLAHLGFSNELALNHNGRFDGFLEEIRSQGRLPAPLFGAERFQRSLVAFDSSPIWRDREVLERWWRQRQESAAERVSLFYNTITLHDGNRVVQADGSTRSADYSERARRLLDDLNAFIDRLESSGRRVVLALVPEHGAALHGDRLQIAGMREIPAPSITHVPVGVKLIGLPLAERKEPLQIATPSSYLALAELIARLQAGPTEGQNAYDLANLTRDLPQTAWVAESTGGVVLDYAGTYYLRTREGGQWAPYPQDKGR
ncbi:cellulose biosynthesis protein BcsG [Azotobacter armeniacus]